MNNWTDIVNALFEFGAIFFVALNCKSIFNDKEVKGLSVAAVTFFSVWGYWNIFFYSHNTLMWSCIAGGLVALTNTIYVCQLFYYTKNPGGKTVYTKGKGVKLSDIQKSNNSMGKRK